MAPRRLKSGSSLKHKNVIQSSKRTFHCAIRPLLVVIKVHIATSTSRLRVESVSEDAIWKIVRKNQNLEIKYFEI